MPRDRSAATPDWLERAASSLRPVEREVLVLSARDGLSIGEIASRLEITPEAARSLLEQAICRLDRALGRQDRRWWQLW